MFNPKKIARFWWHAIRLLLPLYAGIFLLAFLAIQLITPSTRGWLLAVKLAASLVPATVAIVGAGILAISYLKALYGLKGYGEAFWHLVHCLFGLASFKPWIRVEEGKIDYQLADPNSFIVKAGGPGNVIVRKDSAAVLEKGGKLNRVVGPGFANLEPFERVYDTVDLRPRRWPLAVNALSKEGIPLTCEADIEFQIQDGGQKRSSETPFPVDLGAVFTAVTSKWIREETRKAGDRVLDWKGRIVVSAGEGTLRFILARHPLERLIAPERVGHEHPRQVIRKELEKALHAAAANVGARILRVELGKIEVRDEITQQWIESWQANWDRLGLEYLATTEAAYHRMVETARAEAFVRRVRDTSKILFELRKTSEQDFLTGAKLQLHLALRNVSSDSLGLTYMPAEAMKLLQNTAQLPPPSGTSSSQPSPLTSGDPGDVT
jgi:regulator of protease activity HflC (stomatin/prohibitin superfamily)